MMRTSLKSFTENHGMRLIAAAIFLTALAATSAARAEDEGIQKAKSMSKAFRAAAKEVMPTVVKITSVTKPQKVERSPGANRFPNGENPFKGTPFEDFFNNSPGFQFRGGGVIPQRQGVGSGVIIDPSGVILTNNHVIAGADEITVKLSDGREFKATDIKSDEQTDLAILHVKADKPLPAAKIGDSDKLDIGDWVIAVGCPFELEFSVSQGIISSKGRVLANNRRADFLQTDAAINPGNSGGPLVNLDGEVIGINTAIATSSGGYQGIGFAIPINLAKWVTDQLTKTGNVQRAYLGVQIAPLTNDLAEKFGVPPNTGAAVSDVMPKTPAALAGVEEGDVIVEFAGKPVTSPHNLQEMVERCPLGSKQPLKVKRGNKSIELTVEMKAMPNSFAKSGKVTDDENATESSSELGIEVSDLTPEVAKQLGAENVKGVVITSVAPDGIAAANGIREGSIIIRIGADQTPVKSVEDFKAAMKKESLAKGVMLLIRMQGGGNQFIVLKKN